jgi:hypothetical protein
VRRIGVIPSPLEDAARIHRATTPDALWRYLATNVHPRAMRNTFEAIVAFQRLHEDRTADALRTAQLLCTDLRWRRVTTPLIVQIEQTGILDEPALDQLAASFLWRDELAWPVPEQWLRDRTVRIRGRNRTPGPCQVVMDRPIPPPLRRWASARVVIRHPEQVTDVLARVDHLAARAGDAVMAGLLDAAGAVPTEARVLLVELGCSWPSGSVRLQALKLLAGTDRHSATQRAMGDVSETVRGWARRLTDTKDPDEVKRPHVVAQHPASMHHRSDSQPSLFG